MLLHDQVFMTVLISNRVIIKRNLFNLLDSLLMISFLNIRKRKLFDVYRVFMT